MDGLYSILYSVNTKSTPTRLNRVAQFLQVSKRAWNLDSKSVKFSSLKSSWREVFFIFAFFEKNCRLFYVRTLKIINREIPL